LPREIGFWLVEAHHVDAVGIGPDMTQIAMGHNGDYVVLTGKASFRAEHRQTTPPYEVRAYEISLEKGQFHQVYNWEGTPEFPGGWDTYIILVEGEPPDAPTLSELFELKKAWLRQNIFLGEYVITGVAGGVAGGIMGTLLKG